MIDDPIVEKAYHDTQMLIKQLANPIVSYYKEDNILDERQRLLVISRALSASLLQHFSNSSNLLLNGVKLAVSKLDPSAILGVMSILENKLVEELELEKELEKRDKNV